MHFLNFDTWHIKESDALVLGEPAAKAVCGIVAVPRTVGEAPADASICTHCAKPNPKRRAMIDSKSRR